MILLRALCAVGIHRPVWKPIVNAQGVSWGGPRIRVCRDCQHPIGRTHRE